MSLLTSRFTLYLKGIAMGAADVVPGVSGGTIAFISGIYEELIGSIGKIGLPTLNILKKNGFIAAWNSINGNFLSILLLGILTSIATLSKLIGYLLDEHPILIWSFFFGLILASVWLVARKVTSWNTVQTISGLVVGTISAYLITIGSAGHAELTYPYVFFCGAIAIIAMILPGISGSFILVLLGAYRGILGCIETLIQALKAADFSAAGKPFLTLIVFASGCIIGLLSFSRALNWMFNRAHDLTVSVLTGFMIGSLNKVWPWKITPGESPLTETNEGHAIATDELNVLPGEWALHHESDSLLLPAVGLMLGGVLLIIVLDRFSPEAK